jgi:hypothetical protein
MNHAKILFVCEKILRLLTSHTILRANLSMGSLARQDKRPGLEILARQQGRVRPGLEKMMFY